MYFSSQFQRIQFVASQPTVFGLDIMTAETCDRRAVQFMAERKHGIQQEDWARLVGPSTSSRQPYLLPNNDFPLLIPIIRLEFSCSNYLWNGHYRHTQRCASLIPQVLLHPVKLLINSHITYIFNQYQLTKKMGKNDFVFVYQNVKIFLVVCLCKLPFFLILCSFYLLQFAYTVKIY